MGNDLAARAALLDGRRELTNTPDVFAFTATLAEGYGLQNIIDVASSRARQALFPGDRHFLGLVPRDIGLEAQLSGTSATWQDFDPTKPSTPKPPKEYLGNSVIVCSEVIERLSDPRPLLTWLSDLLADAPLGVLTTPSREAGTAGPPLNHNVLREWTLPELRSLLVANGFEIDHIGLTYTNERELQKSTITAVLRKPAARPPMPEGFKVAAFLTAYNEADVLEQVATHLKSNGVDVHLIDNWSNDGTYELAQQLLERGVLTRLERYPAGGPTGTFDLQKLSGHVEALAAASGYDWCIHHDCDEIRQGPWLGVSLRESFWRVQSEGFNAVNFTCINFIPVDDVFDRTRDLLQLRYFEFGKREGHFKQIKAWRNQRRSVNLPSQGGHEAAFEGRRVAPCRFLLKHYPIRSQRHGERKILRERHTRWNPEERSKGWHFQYEHFKDDPTFLRSASELLLYESDEQFYRDYLTERLTAVGILRPGEPFQTVADLAKKK